MRIPQLKKIAEHTIIARGSQRRIDGPPQQILGLKKLANHPIEYTENTPVFKRV